MGTKSHASVVVCFVLFLFLYPLGMVSPASEVNEFQTESLHPHVFALKPLGLAHTLPPNTPFRYLMN